MNETNEAPVPVAATPDLNTYEGIKAARRSKTILPTQQNFETALLAMRQRVADLAVASACAQGENHTKLKLLFPVETIAGAKTSWELDDEESKAKCHLSKLIYFYAKLQAGKFHEDHLPSIHNTASHTPEDDYEPEEDEESDEDEMEESDEG